MEEVVGELLRERGLTIAAAESCTGGLLMSRLTDVPGSSAYVRGGVVAYSNELKTDLLGVTAGADRRRTARSANRSRPRWPTASRRGPAPTSASAITGIAGPAGGTPEKPVGTVVIAVRGDRAAAARPDASRSPAAARWCGSRRRRPPSTWCAGCCWIGVRAVRGARAPVRCRCVRRHEVSSRGTRAARQLSAARLHVRRSRGSRWIPPPNLHLTVWFLGEVSDARAGAIARRAAASRSTSRPFELRLAGLRAFPPSGPPRVFWMGVARGARALAACTKKSARGFSRGASSRKAAPTRRT